MPCHSIIDRGPALSELVDERADRVVLTELHEAGDGVQLVGELVGLCAQCVGRALVRGQLSLQGGEFGAVTHRGHGTDVLACAGR